MPSTLLLFCTLGTFAIDRATKRYALDGGSRLAVSAFGRAFLRCRLNRDVARGRLGRSDVMIGVWAMEALLLLVLVGVVPAFAGPVPPASLGLALGGAAGNLYDRVLRGGVVDFIDVGFWPVFNLADVAIVVGVLVAALAVI